MVGVTIQPIPSGGDAVESTTTGGADVRRQAESTASTIVEQAQQTAETQISVKKDEAASALHSVAEAIRDGGQRMRQDQPQIASFAEQAARKVDEASSYIEQHDVRDFVGQVESFARREPVLFLGGAFAIGFMAARFLKASSPTSHDGRGGSANSGDYYGDTRGRSLGSGGTSSDLYAPARGGSSASGTGSDR